jgi:DNA-binding NtrC family response regulator
METEDLERSRLSAPAERGAAVLWIVHSPDADKIQTRHSLAEPITIVRPGGDAEGLAIADARISRQQATLRWRSDGSGCEVRDLDSRNGTFVDGQRVTSAAAPLGSIVRVGDTLMEIALEPPPSLPLPPLVGRSTKLCRMCRDIARVALSDATVLIEGETGTGKELVAAALHTQSGRSGKLVAVNCASIPSTIAESYLFGHRKGAFTGATGDTAGIFEQAQNGTLFLDEVGELRLDLQAKLLRVLETRELTPIGASTPRTTNARFVSATNAGLRAQISAGTFRSDLFARLAVVELAVPPLNRRRSDIPLLMEHFLEQAAPGVGFRISANALETLLLHPWPRNVRELKSLCGRLALAHPAGGELRSADVTAAMSPSGTDAAPATAPLTSSPEPTPAPDGGAPSRHELCEILRSHDGNLVKVAAHFGKDRKQIYRWLELRGLDPRDFRA